jgi:hypothetical protein
MRSFRRCLLVFSLGIGTLAFAQTESEPTVSGPAQENPHKSTGKSYKKGTKRKPIKEKDPNTGQNRRLGNTARMTKKDRTKADSDKKQDSSKRDSGKKSDTDSQAGK